MLASEDIPASDKRVRFAGLKEYEAAGHIRRDLFADGESGTYISDPGTLNELVSQKLRKLAEDAKADGWKWIEVQPEIDHQAVSRFKRVYAPEEPLSSDAEAEIECLERERDSLVDQMEEQEDDGEADTEPINDQIDEIDQRIRAIRHSRKPAYPDETKEHCGAVLSIDRNGGPAFIYGLLRKEDERAIRTEESRSDDGQTAEPVIERKPESSTYSAGLVETLTQHKTAAIAAELLQQPTIALAVLVHALVLSEFALDLKLYRSRSCVQVSTRSVPLQDVCQAPAFVVLERQKQQWLERLAVAEDLWAWCLEQDQHTLLDLLAYCVARSVNGVQAKSEGENNESRLQHADAVAKALAIDMRKWFTPTAETFFSKISKTKIVEALAEVGKPTGADTLKLKKCDLAAVAEREVENTTWLPAQLRISPPQ